MPDRGRLPRRFHGRRPCVIDDHPSFDPEDLLQVLSEQAVTFTSLVPTHHIMMLGLPEQTKRRYDLSRMRKLMISSAPARPDTKLAIMEYVSNSALFELYGSTEAGWVTILRPEEQLTKLGSIGWEWTGCGPIKLLDEKGQEVAEGEVDELFSRTPYAFDGYWKDPERTDAFRGESCSVGDLARRDADGYYWLVDSKHNIIISGGLNVYAAEVENLLGSHPAVKDVAVIGVPTCDMGRGRTRRRRAPRHDTTTEEELLAWCKERMQDTNGPAQSSSSTRLTCPARQPARSSIDPSGQIGVPEPVSGRTRASRSASNETPQVL